MYVYMYLFPTIFYLHLLSNLKNTLLVDMNNLHFHFLFFFPVPNVATSWEQLELVFELESDLRDIVDWAGTGLLVSVLQKTQLVLFDRSHNTGAIDLKRNRSGPFLRENNLLRCRGGLSLLN